MGQGKGFAFDAGDPCIMRAHFGKATEGWEGDGAHCAGNTALPVLYATKEWKPSGHLPPGLPWSRDCARR